MSRVQSRAKRASLGVVDDKFLASYQRSAGNAVHEITLSQQRNKALAKLGASEIRGANGMISQPKKGALNLLPNMFNDPEVEYEYQTTAFLMHRPFVVWILWLFSMLYFMVMVGTLTWDLGLEEEMRSASSVAIAATSLRSAEVKSGQRRMSRQCIRQLTSERSCGGSNWTNSSISWSRWQCQR